LFVMKDFKQNTVTKAPTEYKMHNMLQLITFEVKELVLRANV
jgi:hypothetical protein